MNTIDDIYKLYCEGYTPKQLVEKGYCFKDIEKAISGRRRSRKEACRLTALSKPQMSSEIRDKISETMKDLHKQGKIKRWNISRRKKSYAEEKFFNFLIQLGYKYEDDFYTEYPFGLFKADFYFPKKKIVIEIDGQQHKNRLDTDKRKDDYISKNGILVFRISWKAISYDSKEQFALVKDILNQPDKDIIDSFTKSQLRRMKALDQFKLEKRMSRTKQIENDRKEKLKDFESIDKTRGWISRLAEKWQVSHTQVRRTLKLLMHP